MLYGGIDEAGYGPLLGPLAIAAVAVDSSDTALLARELAARGVGDSKQLHDPKDLTPLESVALPALGWLCGRVPTHAAEVFALLGETAAQRSDIPWHAGADELHLPVTACPTPWQITSAQPRYLGGALVHPSAMNRATADGINRANLEWQHIGRQVAQIAALGPAQLTIDRLGGRRYYSAPLSTVFPLREVATVEEAALVSRYTIAVETGMLDVAFRVDGETADPLVALASCIAKYARELHQRLFNAWWSDKYPALRPTAGYGSDAHRWLNELPPEVVQRYALLLVRGAIG